MTTQGTRNGWIALDTSPRPDADVECDYQYRNDLVDELEIIAVRDNCGNDVTGELGHFDRLRLERQFIEEIESGE